MFAGGLFLWLAGSGGADFCIQNFRLHCTAVPSAEEAVMTSLRRLLPMRETLQDCTYSCARVCLYKPAHLCAGWVSGASECTVIAFGHCHYCYSVYFIDLSYSTILNCNTHDIFYEIAAVITLYNILKQIINLLIYFSTYVCFFFGRNQSWKQAYKSNNRI